MALRLVAQRPVTYDGRHIPSGGTFLAKSPADAHVLTVLGHAKRSDADEPTPRRRRVWRDGTVTDPAA